MEATTEVSGMSSRRIDARLRSFFGIGAVALTLGLAMPGLEVARAADETGKAPGATVVGVVSIDPLLVKEAPGRRLEGPKAEPGPSCENPSRPSILDDAWVEYQTQQVLREIAKRAAAQPAAPGSGEQGIVLNGRGYNYRPTRLHPGL